MAIFILLISVGVTAWGWKIGVRGANAVLAFEKYEFENRSSGGVVSFASYEESILHHKQKAWANFKKTLGVVLLIFS